MLSVNPIHLILVSPTPPSLTPTPTSPPPQQQQVRYEIIVLAYQANSYVSRTGGYVAAIVAPVLILGTACVCVCAFKQRTGTSGQSFTDTDENPTYGDYFDPGEYIYYDPNSTSEVEDSNPYYSSDCDYEAGTGTGRLTDNNPLYE